MTLECLKTAFDRLFVNKLRTILTMLGIIIGIASVITITTLGSSLKSTLERTFYSSANMRCIAMYMDYYGDDENKQITLSKIDKIRKRYSPYIEAISYNVYGDRIEAIGENGIERCLVNGSGDGNIYRDDLVMVYGRFINQEDLNSKNMGVVLPKAFAEAYFGSGVNPVGKEIIIMDKSYVVIGVYRNNMQYRGYDDEEGSGNAYVPITTMDFSEESLWAFTVYAKTGVDLEELKSELLDYSREELFDGENMLQGFMYQEELEEVNRALDIVTIVISVIASIALIVGGVGIMNIMLVSVIERTKEIGIRKALGAQNSSIRLQFVMEALVICLIGSIIGIVLGIALGSVLGYFIFTRMLQSAVASEFDISAIVIIRPNMYAVWISVLSSLLIGLIFGSYPAKKASEMSPIDALRYE